MKVWKIDSNWLNKSDKIEHLRFLVVAEDNADPIDIIKDKFDMDMSNMTYLNGKVEYQEAPTAIILP